MSARMTWTEKFKGRVPPADTAPATPVVRSPYSVIALQELMEEDRFLLETWCRAQVQPLYLGDHTAVCRILGRYKLYVDTRDRGFATNVLLDGFWEMWLTQFIARHVRPGMTVIDVGANFGYYSLLLADLVGQAGHVTAIEPNPHVTAHLSHSIKLNGFDQCTRVVAAAAGANCADNVRLFCPQGETKNARVIGQESETSEGAFYAVPQVSLDSITGGRLDFVKIDAEGAETDIIAGMRETLARHKPALVLEFNALRSPTPDMLLRTLQDIYGRIRYIDFMGEAIATDAEQLMSQSRGEDWLLYFASPGT